MNKERTKALGQTLWSFLSAYCDKDFNYMTTLFRVFIHHIFAVLSNTMVVWICLGREYVECYG